MKKLLSLFLAAGLMAALGCDDKKTTKQDKPVTTAPTPGGKDKMPEMKMPDKEGKLPDKPPEKTPPDKGPDVKPPEKEKKKDDEKKDK